MPFVGTTLRRWQKPATTPTMSGRLVAPEWEWLWRHMLAGYACNEPGGDRLWDVSGRGKHGTFAGGAASPSRLVDATGRFLRFAAASSQRVSLPVILGARLGWTIAVLVRWTDNTNKMTLWSEVIAAGNPTHNMGILGLNRTQNDTLTAGVIFHVMYDSTGTGFDTDAAAFGATPINDGKWHLMVSTCRGGTPGSLREASYDGAAAILDTASGATLSPAPDTAALGVQPFTAPLEFGSFDLHYLLFLDTYVPMSVCAKLWADPFAWLRPQRRPAEPFYTRRTLHPFGNHAGGRAGREG